MSITRGIEIWKKDQIEGEVYNSRWVGWKDRDLDHWIFLYLNRCVDGSLLRWIRSDDLFVEEVPKEIFADMADRLLSRRYDLELGEDEQDDMERLEEYRPRYYQRFRCSTEATDVGSRCG